MKKQPDPKDRNFNYEKKLSFVCEEFCKGEGIENIVKHLRSAFPAEVVSRETPYRLLRVAAQRGWLKFLGPKDEFYEQQLLSRYNFFQGQLPSGINPVTVVQSASAEQLADAAAEMVLDLIKAKKRSGRKEKEIHIGWAGGKTMARTAKILARLLSELSKEEAEQLPETLVWHSLMAGLDPNWPGLSPAAFLPNFADISQRGEENRPKHRFVVFGAPPLVNFSMYAKLKALPTIEEAFEERKKIKIIVTSAGSFHDKHSVLKTHFHNFFEKHRKEKASRNVFVEFLARRNCVGDLLWLPLCPDQPVNFEELSDAPPFEYRPMTLLELSDLPDMINRGTSVVLAIGPCQICGASKKEVLRSILDLSESATSKQLISHLVTNRETASAMLDSLSPLKAGWKNTGPHT
jgi:DNA-binding transcriptional regulator LsrR (DeoR family)